MDKFCFFLGAATLLILMFSLTIEIATEINVIAAKLLAPNTRSTATKITTAKTLKKLLILYFEINNRTKRVTAYPNPNFHGYSIAYSDGCINAPIRIPNAHPKIAEIVES
jgi:hypothetical protein